MRTIIYNPIYDPLERNAVWKQQQVFMLFSILYQPQNSRHGVQQKQPHEQQLITWDEVQ